MPIIFFILIFLVDALAARFACEQGRDRLVDHGHAGHAAAGRAGSGLRWPIATGGAGR